MLEIHDDTRDLRERVHARIGTPGPSNGRRLSAGQICECFFEELLHRDRIELTLRDVVEIRPLRKVLA